MNENTELSKEKSLKEICAEAVVRANIKKLFNTIVLPDPMNIEEFLIATKNSK